MDTPVVLIIFNRPELAEETFRAIRKASPKQLFVIADGPRKNHPKDEENCLRSREVVNLVDWECEVIKIFSSENMGAGLRPATGITEVFRQVDQAIILEDDCLPNETFFKYCEFLLDRYKEEEQVMNICGTNLLGKWKADQQSYFFSNLGNVWGWATWSRAWKHYDFEMKLWGEEYAKDKIKNVLRNDLIFEDRKKRFESVFHGELNSAWDHQWLFARLLKGGLSINPSVNLVSNIGFSADATHTKNSNDKRAGLPTYEMSLPLRPPASNEIDYEFDFYRFQNVWKKSFKGNVLKFLEQSRRRITFF